MITSESILNERFGKFFSALRKESDRGAALASAGFAEELLNKMLSSFLADVPETKELINGFAAPIGTYSSKIKLAYVLGILDKELYTNFYLSLVIP